MSKVEHLYIPQDVEVFQMFVCCESFKMSTSMFHNDNG